MQRFCSSSLLSIAIGLSLSVYAQKTENVMLKKENFKPFDVSVKEETYKGKAAIVLEQPIILDNQKTFALIQGIEFHNGTIEATISGQVCNSKVEGARGFVGIVFRVNKDTSQFEKFYLRPTNGRANDQVRRNHSLQYVSYPGHPWEKLRKETPEKYESYADIQPAEWTRIKIVIKDESAQLFINGADQPNLIVNDLKQGKELKGSIGLWIGPGTLAHFSDIKITKLD